MTVSQNRTGDEPISEPQFRTAREIRLDPTAGEIGSAVRAICVEYKTKKNKRAPVDPDGSASFKHVCHTCQKSTFWNVVEFLRADR